MMILIFCAVIVVASSTAIPKQVASASGATSSNNQPIDSNGNYAFAYNTGEGKGSSFRKEVGDSAGNKYGSYGLTGADGKVRIVNYVADAKGFRADIKSDEEGVKGGKVDPADTSVNKGPIVITAHALPFTGPITFSGPIPGPFIIHTPFGGLAYATALAHTPLGWPIVLHSAISKSSN